MSANRNHNFNAIEYRDRAVNAGIDPKTADFHAREMADFVNNVIVTKNDVDVIVDKISTRLDNLENVINLKISKGVNELLLKVPAYTAGLLGIVAAIIKYLIHG